jgi:uncharacterized membrane protein YccC
MMDIVIKQNWLSAWKLSRPSAALTDALRAAGPPLLFGLRLWASVCLALYIAFWLELDNPFWAGTSAAIVCQPQLGASLRKGWFRMIGTLIGATMIVVLTGCFPQDRIAFLGLLALWGSVCAFGATILRNFASYSAALAGYTAAIIAADTLGATGGPSSDVFLLAGGRATEICLGIVCAGIVLAGTDLGGARRRLAALFANLGAEIAGQFTRMLALAEPGLPDTQAQRREFTGRVIALDPAVDQAIGESSQVRYHSPILQAAVHGLFRALDGWRGVAVHLRRLPEDTGRRQAEALLRSIPAELQSASKPVSPERWLADPSNLRRACEKAVRTLIALPAGTPSFRLLADETAKTMSGIVRVLDGLTLLDDGSGRPLPGHRGFRLSVPDWLPPLVNLARAFVAIGAVELFWLVTAWPNGALAIVFVAIAVLLLSPRGDLAYLGSLAFALATAGGIVGAAIIKFTVLPGFETFPGFCAAIGLWLIPVGFAMARSRTPALIAIFSALGVNFLPLLSATNPMIYDTAQFYNSALAIFVGCGTVPVTFLLLPPLSPALRARRLLALTLRDLRLLATAPLLPRSEDWERRIYARLEALPDQAEPVQRARLGTALSVGAKIIHLRFRAPRLGVTADLDAALAAVARGDSAMARVRLARLDRELASCHGGETGSTLALRMRAQILVVSEALEHHATYFDGGAAA